VTSVLGSLLKQIVSQLEKVPEEISKAFSVGKRPVRSGLGLGRLA